MTKKLISSFLAIALIVTMLPITALAIDSAAPTISTEKVEIELVGFTERDIDISEVPAGITPVVMSEEDYQSFLLQMEEGITVSRESTSSGITRSSTAKLTSSGYIMGAFPFTKPKLTLYVNVNHTNGYITSVRNHGWQLTGLSPGVDISETTSYASVSSGWLSANGDVVIDYYLLVDGLVKLYSVSAWAGIETSDPYSG